MNKKSQNRNNDRYYPWSGRQSGAKLVRGEGARSNETGDKG